ncbi:tetraacyldisaccharide 4'-kinase [Desulfosarcina alkanivorans]|uniref:Tetraacyldisaccharide 4'-kinase n=1 Tax=Desulfosarcina alkanivorans TaxID=571177 RepID=A0A5K7YHF6_9BACT|nr:tetraacyldisaccharide 4'-kinase [Desulfosarcina alkanivorans]BBO67500.1 tetraacyldisaccharide 4'-kinase [Desulfosarcina alkanivorans]
MNRLKDDLERLRCRIESAAKGNLPAPFFSLETALSVLSILYGGVMGIRALLYRKGVLPSETLPCRVVSIGNLIAGGTGKTPMTIMVAQCIRDLGFRVVVISRGYRGRMEDAGGIVSDAETVLQGPENAGDEPFLMAGLLKGIPVVVGRRRFDSGMMAVKRFQPDVIVLDDAFQHLRLKRDLNLVLLDSRSPFANGRLLPRGLLREPLSALKRAHAIVYTRCQDDGLPSGRGALPVSRPVFYTDHIPVIRRAEPGDGALFREPMDLSALKGRKTVAFSGLADNRQFFHSLKQAGCELVHAFSFPDHHRYGSGDLKRIAETARKTDADVVATTYKDFVKIEGETRWPVALVAIDVEIRLFGDRTHFLNFISEGLSEADG